MDISYDLFYNDDDARIDVDVLKFRRRIRDDSNPLELPNTKFINYFRLSKEAFCYLLDEIKDVLKEGIRGTAIPPILKLCAALRFFADGSYQKCSQEGFNIGLAQPTISVALTEILNAIEERICSKWISVTMSEDEQNASKLAFDSNGFPGVLGCIDGTHIRINSPQKDLQHLYLNHNGYYSLNVMIMCDYKMNIRYVDAKNPGSYHDALIFNLSTLKLHLQRNTKDNSWILGDAGYPLLPYLMTPFGTCESNSPEARYDNIHAKARNIVQRTIGVLKSRFRCLNSTRGLHYTPQKATQIVKACCALHNISQHFNVDLVGDLTLSQDEANRPENINVEPNDSAVAVNIRNNIMRSFHP